VKRLIRKIIVHLIVISFIRANKKGKKTIAKAVFKHFWRKLK
jgi:hypothetical protein